MPHPLQLVLLPWLLLLVACERQTEVEIASEENILLVGNAAEPKSLDPQKVTGVVESKLITSMFEGLVADHPSRDDVMVPGTAISWEHNEDYTEWTFHLRPEARWSDGTPLTSADFVYAYRRMLAPVTAAPYAGMLYDFIEGAEAFNQGEAKDFSTVGVEAPDEHTLLIRCREPVPYLPSVTRHYTWFPVPRHLIEKLGGLDDPFNPWTEPKHIVSNGPFKLADWRFRAWIEVERNPYYWDAENVRLEGIRFIPIENYYTEARAYLAGQLHTTYTLPPDMVEATAEEHPEHLRQEPYVGTVFLRLNTTGPPLDDPQVRRALSLAINREAYVDNITVGYSEATTLTPRMGEYFAGDLLAYDPKHARELLAEAGFPGGRGFPQLDLLISSSKNRAGAEAIQSMLNDNLGIQVGIQPLDWGSYIAAQQQLDYDIAAAGWIGDYLDPTTFLNMWTEGGGNNNTGWSSERYEELLGQAAVAPNPTERNELLVEAERLFVEDAAIIPIAWYARNYLHSPRVRGWYPLLLDNHPWKWISLVDPDKAGPAPPAEEFGPPPPDFGPRPEPVDPSQPQPADPGAGQTTAPTGPDTASDLPLPGRPLDFGTPAAR